MSTYFEGTRWQTAWFPIAGNTPIAAPGQHVTAVWRNANHLDLFITAKDGKVMSTYFESNKWQPGWFAINPASAVAVPGQTITLARAYLIRICEDRVGFASRPGRPFHHRDLASCYCYSCYSCYSPPAAPTAPAAPAAGWQASGSA